MAKYDSIKIIWMAIIVYIAFFGIFTSLRHYNFQTQTWDLAVFDQTFWNTIHGRIMFNNLEEIQGPLNHLAVHMRPLMLILSIGYLFFPTPYYLLIIQTIAIGIGALPLYLFSEKILKDSKAALIIAIAYLLYPGLHWVNTFDFHEIAFLIPAILFGFYFLEKKNFGLAGISFALGAFAKEDAILVIAFIGLFLFIKKENNLDNLKNWLTKDRHFGLLLAIISIIYFIIAIKVLMPALGGGLLRLDRYSNLGKTPLEIARNTLQNPLIIIKTIINKEKLRYVFWFFLPVAFLPFFSGRALILLIPGLLENLLTNFGLQFSGLYQYDAILIGSMFICAVYGFKNIREKYRNLNLKLVLIIFSIIGYMLRSPVNPVFFPIDLFKSNPHWDNFREIVKMIPDNVSVSAQTNLVPHLDQREYAFKLGTETFPVDVLAIDGADLSGFLNQESFQAYTDNYMNSGQYNFLTIKNRYFIIYKKGISLKSS